MILPKLIFLTFFFIIFVNAAGYNRIDAEWHPMNTPTLPDPASPGQTCALLTTPDDKLYAGGNFGVIQWNGSIWEKLGNGLNGMVYTIASDNNGNIYAGGDIAGYGNVAQWNGTTWLSLGKPFTKTVRSIVVDKNGNVYAGGDFDSVNGIPSKYVAKWNGASWTGLGTGITNIIYTTNKRVYALAVDSAGNLYAGGDFTFTSSSGWSSVVKWDGDKWVGFGTSFGTAYALLVDRQGSIYVAGSLISMSTNITFGKLIKWDGQDWIDIPLSYVPNKIYTLTSDTSGNIFFPMMLAEFVKLTYKTKL